MAAALAWPDGPPGRQGGGAPSWDPQSGIAWRPGKQRDTEAPFRGRHPAPESKGPVDTP